MNNFLLQQFSTFLKIVPQNCKRGNQTSTVGKILHNKNSEMSEILPYVINNLRPQTIFTENFLSALKPNAHQQKGYRNTKLAIAFDSVNIVVARRTALLNRLCPLPQPSNYCSFQNTPFPLSVSVQVVLVENFALLEPMYTTLALIDDGIFTVATVCEPTITVK